MMYQPDPLQEMGTVFPISVGITGRYPPQNFVLWKLPGLKKVAFFEVAPISKGSP